MIDPKEYTDILLDTKRTEEARYGWTLFIGTRYFETYREPVCPRCGAPDLMPFMEDTTGDLGWQSGCGYEIM